MPDNLLDNQIKAAADENTVGAALQREAILLRDGIGQGVSQRLSDKADLLQDASIAFGGALALRCMLNAGGKWGTAGKVLASGFTLALGYDVARRAIPTAGAMIDTWHSGNNMAENTNTVANNLGTAVVDYTVMGLAGAGGWKVGGKLMPQPTFTMPELGNMRNIMDKAAMGKTELPPATRAMIENSIPINADTRAAAQAGKLGAFDKLPKFEPLGGNINAIKFDAAKLNIGSMVEIRATRIFPTFPVVPVDFHDQAQVLHMQKLENPFKVIQGAQIHEQVHALIEKRKN